MARCAFCSTTILFGGKRVGDHVFCNGRCLLRGRPLLLADDSTNDLWDAMDALREDMLVLADELHELRAAMSETNERLDFSERTMVQMREAQQASSSGEGREQTSKD